LVNDPDSVVAFFATAAVIAHVASNRINQIQDPGLSIEQAIASFRRPRFYNYLMNKIKKIFILFSIVNKI